MDTPDPQRPFYHLDFFTQYRQRLGLTLGSTVQAEYSNMSTSLSCYVHRKCIFPGKFNFGVVMGWGGGGGKSG